MIDGASPVSPAAERMAYADCCSAPRKTPTVTLNRERVTYRLPGVDRLRIGYPKPIDIDGIALEWLWLPKNR